MATPPVCIVVCGLPGSGKTTTATELATARKALRLCPDDWMRWLHIDLWAEEGRQLVERLQWRMAKELLVLGTSVVIEWGTWQRSERDLVRETCRALGVGVELHFLDVPIPVLQERLAARNGGPGETVIQNAHLQLWSSSSFEAPTAEELALFDPPAR